MKSEDVVGGSKERGAVQGAHSVILGLRVQESNLAELTLVHNDRHLLYDTQTQWVSAHSLQPGP